MRFVIAVHIADLKIFNAQASLDLNAERIAFDRSPLLKVPATNTSFIVLADDADLTSYILATSHINQGERIVSMAG